MGKKELRFDGQVALVTGGGAGMGRSYCIELAKRGAKVVVVDYNVPPIDGQTGDEGGRDQLVADELKEIGHQAIGVNCDVRDDADCRKAVQAAIDTFGRLDIIVNNAGTTEFQTQVFEDPGPYFDAQIDIHVKAPLLMARAAWPHMERQKYGRIIVTGSASSFGFSHSGRTGGGYPIAKGGALSVVRQLANAGESRGILTNLILPRAFSRLIAHFEGTDLYNWHKKWLLPELVAKGAIPFVHNDCPCNGQWISVAGGRVARVVLATPKGYYNRNLEPEDVLENWETIAGKVDPDNFGKFLAEVYELPNQDREQEIMRSFYQD